MCPNNRRQLGLLHPVNLTGAVPHRSSPRSYQFVSTPSSQSFAFESDSLSVRHVTPHDQWNLLLLELLLRNEQRISLALKVDQNRRVHADLE